MDGELVLTGVFTASILRQVVVVVVVAQCLLRLTTGFWSVAALVMISAASRHVFMSRAQPQLGSDIVQNAIFTLYIVPNWCR